MKIHNLYTDEDGESHFRDIEIEWEEERNFSKYSARMPANGIIFRETSGDYDLDWHPAPRRQYVINLDAGVEVTASDGNGGIGAGRSTGLHREHRVGGNDEVNVSSFEGFLLLFPQLTLQFKFLLLQLFLKRVDRILISLGVKNHILFSTSSHSL